EDDRNGQAPRSCLQGVNRHAAIHEAEEKQRDLHRIFPPDLKLTECIPGCRASIDEKSWIARRVRHEGQDWNQRERRMDATPKEGEPRKGAGPQEVRPEVLDSAPTQPESHSQCYCQNRRPRSEMKVTSGLEQGELKESQRVGRDRQEE